MSRICCLKLCRLKFCSQWCQEGFAGLPHPLQYHLCKKGELVLAYDHSKVQSCISQAVTGFINCVLNQTFYMFPEEFLNSNLPAFLWAAVQEVQRQTSFRARQLKSTVFRSWHSRRGDKMSWKMTEGKTCNIPRFHDLALEYKEEESSYFKCFSIKTNSFW